MIIIAEESNPLFCTFDHKVPRSRGGGDGIYNLVLACRQCNDEKKNYIWLRELIKDSA